MKKRVEDWQTAMVVGDKFWGWGWEGPTNESWKDDDTWWFKHLACTYREKWSKESGQV